MESKVIELQGPKQISVKNKILDIDNLKHDQVAAETYFTAISPGTEISAFKGDPPLRPMKVYPRVVGYCNIAKIIAIGKSVCDYNVGDFILTHQSHRSAFICSADQILALVPSSADLARTSTTYLFHLGYNALMKGGVRPGHNLAILGLGTLGLSTVAVSKFFGANTFAISGRNEILPLAEELGAKLAFNKNDLKIEEMLAPETGNIGIDIVVTTSNSWPDWNLALKLPRKGGKICVIGFPGRTDPIPDFNPLDSRYFYDQQLSIVACGYTPDKELPPHDLRFNLKRNCKFLLEQIINNNLPANRIVSSIEPWTKIEDIYQNMAARKDLTITVVLEWK
jgi:threonine dehydrogenase-like Zn-dependent dehydrogenase